MCYRCGEFASKNHNEVYVHMNTCVIYYSPGKKEKAFILWYFRCSAPAHLQQRIKLIEDVGKKARAEYLRVSQACFVI